MLVTWRRFADLPAGDEARFWLYGVARRVIANQTRTRTRHGRLGAKLRGDLRATSFVDADPAGAYETRELVQAALAKLPEADRELVLLNTWEGLEPTEIASVVGLAPGTVRTRLHRARGRLRELLAAGGLETEETR
jgi:RNA polymerase sigma factor (sigma-70 family)